MSFQIEAIDTPSEELCEAVNVMLRTHNQRANPEFWKAMEREENQPVPIQLFAFDATREAIGGLFGSTQFQWLKTDIMAVAEASRGSGIGRTLLERAEAIARERGCHRAYVDTMAYQAPNFYEKAGYSVVGRLEDWDSVGHSKYFLVKGL